MCIAITLDILIIQVCLEYSQIKFYCTENQTFPVKLLEYFLCVFAAIPSTAGPPATASPPVTQSTPSTTPNNGPFNCNFDTNMCGWVQDRNDQFDWTRFHGATSTASTGPSADHTQGNASEGSFLWHYAQENYLCIFSKYCAKEIIITSSLHTKQNKFKQFKVKYERQGCVAFHVIY